MPLEIITIGEALVEVMRTRVDDPLDRVSDFVGPFPSGALGATRKGPMEGAFTRSDVEHFMKDQVVPEH